METVNLIIGFILLVFAANILLLLPLAILKEIIPNSNVKKWFQIAKKTAKVIFLWFLLVILLSIIVGMVIPPGYFL
tara:strand:+ start:208 stop:435 length:228 start_codon:yes stop_codon:yes gene_type:complete